MVIGRESKRFIDVGQLIAMAVWTPLYAIKLTDAYIETWTTGGTTDPMINKISTT